MSKPFTTTDPDLLLAEVKKSGWSYFDVPLTCRTREMAVLAWPNVRCILAMSSRHQSPAPEFLSEEEWEQFMGFLCGGNALYLLLAESSDSWQEIIQAIDANIATEASPLSAESLPVFE